LVFFYYTPERKKQSKQWIEKRKPGHIKAWVHTSPTKQLVAYLQHIVPRGCKANAISMVKVLGIFTKNLRKNRLVKAFQ
jgi:hypothetical protein